jgi:hypothetical protein
MVAKEDFLVVLRGLCKDPRLLMLIHMLATQIHWFSIFNSFMMVIFLTGLVSMILMRTLRNDYAKYAREEDDLETLVSKTILNHNLWSLEFRVQVMICYISCIQSYKMWSCYLLHSLYTHPCEKNWWRSEIHLPFLGFLQAFSAGKLFG